MINKGLERLILLAVLAGGSFSGSGCEEKQAPPPRERISPRLAPRSPAPPVARIDSMSQVRAHLTAYASRAAGDPAVGGKKDVRMAVLPFEESGGGRTALSDWLADTLSSALSESGLAVVDRSRLKQIMEERNLSQTSATGAVGKILKADYLLVGQYSLVGRNISVSIKAVSTDTSRKMLAQTYAVVTDKAIRALAFAKRASAGGGGSARPDPGSPTRLWEEEGFIVVSACHKDTRTDQHYLLDRVRQVVRDRLFAYARQVLSVGPSVDLERWFRNGEVMDCNFDGGSVVLKMKFKTIGEDGQ